MNSIPNNPILQFPLGTLDNIREIYDLNQKGRISESVDILEDWVIKQTHFFKKNFSRDYLERILISTKGSVERAKMRMDKYCTFKTLIPNIFGTFNIREDFESLLSTMPVVILPKFAPNYYRVLIQHCTDKKFYPSIIQELFKFSTIFCEYWRLHDYQNGFIVVLDYSKLNLSELLSSINPMELRQVLMMFIEGYGVRLKGIHIITQSKMADMLVKLLKQMVTPKIGARIHIHRTIEELYDFIPRDILPEDFGGDEKYMEELTDEWVSVLGSKEHMAYVEEMMMAKTDESLRPIGKFNEDYMGMPGSFRTLHLD